MAAPETIKRLIRRYAENRQTYESLAYVEASLRQDFLDPMISALGWDVGNRQGLPEHLREVVIESRLDVDGGKKAPDYAFRVGGKTKFFLEAKKPSVKIKVDPAPAHQVRTYGWNGKVAYSVLCDFQELSLYDTRIKPEESDSASVARLHYLTFDKYVDEWDWIAERFHRDSVVDGKLDRIAADERVRRGSVPVDDAILDYIEHWRLSLAKNIRKNNPGLSVHDLSSAVQTIIDRILFLRICEDRGIEPYQGLREASKKPEIYPALVEMFFRADERYNSGLFHLKRERGRGGTPDVVTSGLHVDNRPLKQLIDNLYWPRSAFDFRILGAQVLGNVYEQFLGKVIAFQGVDIRIDEKPEVKKAGGVVYTPEMVVDHIVDETLVRALNNKTIAQVSGTDRGKFAHPLRVLDASSGSGSFLIVAYERLLNWYLEQYLRDTGQAASGRNPKIFRSSDDLWLLTTGERKRILIDHIFGVDVDEQAVEVTKLSLLLKVLENESAETLDQQLTLFKERALPDLDRNIRCGNSLISTDFFSDEPSLFKDESRMRQINPFSWTDEFPEILHGSRPGFDVIVGNPPYVVIQGEFRDDSMLAYYRSHYRAAAYKVDLYHLFIEKCLELTRNDGYLGLITPTNWMTNNYLQGLRRLILTGSRLEEVAVLDRSVFAQRAVDCAIMTARRGKPAKEITVSRYVPDVGRNYLDLVQGTKLDVAKILATKDALLTGSHASDDVAPILDRISNATEKLSMIANVNFGKQVRNRKIYTSDVLHLDGLSRKIPVGYRSCLTGGDVTRWAATWSGLACTTDLAARSGGSWNPDIQDQQVKVLCRQVGLFPDFGLDSHGHQCLNTMFMVTPKEEGTSPYYLLGVLNSLPVRAYWLDRFWDRRRTFPKIKGGYLKELPLPGRVDPRVATLAERLQSITTEMLGLAGDSHRREQLARVVTTSERELDAIVGDAFGLSSMDLRVLSEFVANTVRQD
ncbi:hypothetical protein GCM10027596_31880 [Nocardioides korecus]